MHDKLLLVGSVPFDSAERVLTVASQTLGEHLDCIPDGEVLDRRYWIFRLMFQVFNGHGAFETVRRPAAPAGGERLIPVSREDAWRFRLKSGIEQVGFDMPGWRLGYAKDAQNSYAIFSGLKREGKVRPEARFQVSVPAVNSVCNPAIFGTDEAELKIIRAGFQEILIAEVETICRVVPPGELAVQYDCSFEVTDVHGAAGLSIGPSIARNVAQIGPLTAAVHQEAQLGFHLCFGTFGGWPRFAPEDLTRTVELANAMSAASTRLIDWFHIPALDTADPRVYAPLSKLAVGDARIYLGLIHSMESFAERYEAARKVLPDFGLAAYCGFGRLEPEQVDGILQEHLAAVSTAKALATNGAPAVN